MVVIFSEELVRFNMLMWSFRVSAACYRGWYGAVCGERPELNLCQLKAGSTQKLPHGTMTYVGHTSVHQSAHHACHRTQGDLQHSLADQYSGILQDPDGSQPASPDDDYYWFIMVIESGRIGCTQAIRDGHNAAYWFINTLRSVYMCI